MGAIQSAFPAVPLSGGSISGNLAVNGNLSGDTVQLIGTNAISGANAGLDAAFANTMRLYNNYAGGNTQIVTPNGAVEFFCGGNNTLNVGGGAPSYVPNIPTTAGGAQACTFGASAAMGLYWGSGAPTVSAPQGSLYLRTDGTSTTRAYINTNGATTWTAINTVG